MFIEEYYNNVLGLINRIYQTQYEKLREGGRCIAEVLKKDGLIHVFGCGHSHMLAEDLFYRAGGLVNINAIFDSSVMLHEGAAKSSKIERMHGMAQLLLDRYETQPGDILLISSNSGINPYPIEMALAGKNKGLKVIAITSSAYASSASLHNSGKHLSQVCDLFIDNCVGKGDASVVVTENEIKAGPLSSFGTFFAAQEMIMEACEQLKQSGISPNIYLSGNLPGTDEHNTAYVRHYKKRIKHL